MVYSGAKGRGFESRLAQKGQISSSGLSFLSKKRDSNAAQSRGIPPCSLFIQEPGRSYIFSGSLFCSIRFPSAVKKPFYLHQRGGVWYYRLNRDSGIVDRDERIWHSTGFSDRKGTENYVFDFLGIKREVESGSIGPTFREYSAPFFVRG